MLITPATPLPPYKEELGPRTNSILSIECTGIASQSTPLLKVLFIGTPLSNTKMSVDQNREFVIHRLLFGFYTRQVTFVEHLLRYQLFVFQYLCLLQQIQHLVFFMISSIVLVAVTVMVCDTLGSSATLVSAAYTMDALIAVKIIENNMIFDVLVCLKLVTVFFRLPFFIFMTLYTDK